LRRARAFAAVLRFLPRRVARVEYALAETQTALRELDRRAEQAARSVEDNTRQLQIRAVMDWIERASLDSRPLVSVVLPTRNRCSYLARALASLHGQSYPHWEAVVVDDGSIDNTPAALAAVRDERVKPIRGCGAGTCAARNLALARIGGKLVAYLDDDNLMHPNWLKTVVWAFEQRPEADVLYGAFVVDDPARIKRQGRGELPRLFFHPYDHKAVAENNIADIGCIAHRAGLAEARFDELLQEMGDWDFFLRLTREKPPLAVPAVACFYTTDAPNRTTNGPTHERDLATVRTKNRR
jgi:glycosyl transferase family 2